MPLDNPLETAALGGAGHVNLFTHRKHIQGDGLAGAVLGGIFNGYLAQEGKSAATGLEVPLQRFIYAGRFFSPNPICRAL